jgi:hypothetical protein
MKKMEDDLNKIKNGRRTQKNNPKELSQGGTLKQSRLVCPGVPVQG